MGLSTPIPPRCQPIIGKPPRCQPILVKPVPPRCSPTKVPPRCQPIFVKSACNVSQSSSCYSDFLFMAKVVNVHQRTLEATPNEVGALIDSLSSKKDALWPTLSWPPMKFDRPLGEGAAGGHGPIQYFVEEYTPGQSVRFRFTGPDGFNGYHEFQTVVQGTGSTVLRHSLKMTTRGFARLSWPVVFRPLHNALVEDALTTAEASLGLSPRSEPWSPWVRFVRWALTGGKAGPQKISRL